MKRLFKNYLLLLAAGLVSLPACSDYNEDMTTQDLIPQKEEYLNGISATVSNFEMGELDLTRTSYEVSPTEGFVFQWAPCDTLGIYPVGGNQVDFPISDGIGTNTAVFDGGSWALRSSYTYAGYYPYSANNYHKPQNAIPVSYKGQKQNGNNNLSGLGAYDFMAAAPVGTSENGSVDLLLKHLGSFVRFQLTMPMAGNFTQLTMECNDVNFIETATYDLTSSAPTLKPETYSKSFTLSLENIQTTEANQVITLYAMMAPVNQKTSNITVTITDENGRTFSKLTTGKNLVAGKSYNYSLELERETCPYLTFEANDIQTLKMSEAVETFEFSLNGGEWFELGTNTVTFGGHQGNLRLRGKSEYGSVISYDSPHIIFGTRTAVSCKGDIRTLIDYENYDLMNEMPKYARFGLFFWDCDVLTSAPELPATTLSSDACYSGMFRGCTSLTSAPELPATTLSEFCYSGMFEGCTSLTSAPELPATTIPRSCYSGMFRGCTSLTSAPELPATTLIDGCYREMFSGCTSLTSAPDLPATTLSESCYYGMFSGCTSLTSAPELPATTLPSWCYDQMFSGCTSLTSAPDLPATTLSQQCYKEMFRGCTSLTSAPDLPATTLPPGSCYYGMFWGCTSLTSAPKLSATTLSVSCCQYMFRGCTSLTSAPELPATTLSESCYNGMFWDCTSLTSAPELPATTLADFCCQYMFRGCTSLTSAPELPATTLDFYCYHEMFRGCTSLTSAPEFPATTLDNDCYGCYQGMFSGCTSLNYIKMNNLIYATDDFHSYLYRWLQSVSETGTLVINKNAKWDMADTSVIPEGWNIVLE